MKIVKFSYLNEKKVSYGVIHNKYIIPISNSIYDERIITEKGIRYDMKKCKFYLPINSSKIIGVAQNFKKLNKINNPLFFLKSDNSLCLQNKVIKLPINAKIWGESELAFVIKKKISKPIKLNECEKYICENSGDTSNLEDLFRGDTNGDCSMNLDDVLLSNFDYF